MREIARSTIPPWLILSVAVCGTSMAGIGEFTVSPTQPACEEPMTFHVAGGFSDGCWEVTEIDFFYADNILGFVIYALDHWQPGWRCTDEIVSYEATEVVAPPPSGAYSGVAYEIVESQRQEQGDQASVFVLACCPGNEAPLTDLRLNKLDEGRFLQFSWSDVPGAQDFHLYGDDNPDGPFEIEFETTSNLDLTLLNVNLPGFFLLSQSSDCGEGPKH